MERKQWGFTLIELLIVVAIIGILAAIAVPNFLNAQVRAKVSRTVADMRALHSALEAYFIDNNGYPPDFDAGCVPNGPSIRKNESLSYGKLTSPISYMSSIPTDPFFLGSYGHELHQQRTEDAIPYFQYKGPCDDQQPFAGRTIYTMTSLGPDQEDQRAWSFAHKNAHQVLYQTSNGLNSKGDLYTSNIGVLF